MSHNTQKTQWVKVGNWSSWWEAVDDGEKLGPLTGRVVTRRGHVGYSGGAVGRGPNTFENIREIANEEQKKEINIALVKDALKKARLDIS